MKLESICISLTFIEGIAIWLIVETDRYDFHYDKDYWGTIQGYAVYIMLVAQNMGVLTPYYVYIIHA